MFYTEAQASLSDDLLHFPVVCIPDREHKSKDKLGSDQKWIWGGKLLKIMTGHCEAQY